MSTRETNNPILCEHANEVPVLCHCGPDCYCKTHTCRINPELLSDVEHLQWIFTRLVVKHGENPNYDYMLRFKKVIDGLVANPVIKLGVKIKLISNGNLIDTIYSATIPNEGLFIYHNEKIYFIEGVKMDYASNTAELHIIEKQRFA